jgi:hypothetical protein
MRKEQKRVKNYKINTLMAAQISIILKMLSFGGDLEYIH